MATKQYIGARYVPKFYTNSVDGSAAWENNVVYEPLTYVTLANGHMYLSKKQVPATIGTPASNAEYWLDNGSHNGFIDDLQNQIDAIETVIETMKDDSFANVRDYGAKGDGSTDDMQAFIDALASSKAVYVPTGTYRVSSALTVDAGVHVFGDGLGKSIIKFDAQTATQKYVFQNYTNTTKKGAIFRDLSIDVNTYAQDPKKFNGGIFLQNFTDVLIDNVEIYNTSEGGNGITLWGCTRATISNCYMHRLYGSGIYVCENSSIVNIFNNKVIDCIVTSGCIDCWASNNIVIEGNYVSSGNSTTFGMNIDTGRQIIIANNNCNGSNTGIAIFSSNEMTIIGNRCRNNTFAGIELQKNLNGDACYNINILDNDLMYGGQFGIIDSGAGSFTKIKNNRISLSQRHGIYIVNGSLTDISGNTITDSSLETANTYTDIFISGSGQYITINDNYCYSGQAVSNIYTGANVGAVMCVGNTCVVVGGSYNINIAGQTDAIVENNRGTSNVA